MHSMKLFIVVVAPMDNMDDIYAARYWHWYLSYATQMTHLSFKWKHRHLQCTALLTQRDHTLSTNEGLAVWYEWIMLSLFYYVFSTFYLLFRCRWFSLLNHKFNGRNRKKREVEQRVRQTERQRKGKEKRNGDKQSVRERENDTHMDKKKRREIIDEIKSISDSIVREKFSFKAVRKLFFYCPANVS